MDRQKACCFPVVCVRVNSIPHDRNDVSKTQRTHKCTVLCRRFFSIPMKYREQSLLRRGLGAVFVAGLMVAFVRHIIVTDDTTMRSDEGGGTMHNSIRMDATTRLILAKSVERDCPVKTPKLQSCEIGTCPQMYSASFPGSGAELFRAVVEAITGYTASEVYKKKDLHQHFLIKTHSPMLSQWAVPLLVEPQSAIYLIRNPLWSLPSYFNWEYESSNKLPDHSAQAPEEQWIKWRNQNFQKHFQNYMEHIEYWMDRYEPQNLFIIPYERLIDQESGPMWTFAVGRFLQSKTSVKVVQPDWIGCLWKTIVKGGKSKKRGAKKYSPNFTDQQLEVMEQSIQELKQRRSHKFPVLSEILQSYIVHIQQCRAEEKRVFVR